MTIKASQSEFAIYNTVESILEGSNLESYSNHICDLGIDNINDLKEITVEDLTTSEGITDSIAEKIHNCINTHFDPMFDKEGIHYIPAKVLVLDEIKLLKENKSSGLLNNKNLLKIHSEIHNAKTILIVGETGAGKTTLINSMMNYLYNVTYKDKYRWKLIFEPPTDERQNQAQSQTDQVMGYFLENVPMLNGENLLIIDTPGLGDSRGLTKDQQTLKELKQFFQEKIKFLHGLCFVLKSSEQRLTPSRRYLFDSILSLYGNDMQQNFFTMCTFADASDPPCIEAMKQADIPFDELRLYKFNNSSFFLAESEEISGNDSHKAVINSTYYQIAIDEFDRFFCHIKNINPVWLHMKTSKLLRKRQELDNLLNNFLKEYHQAKEILATVQGHQERSVQLSENADIFKNYSISEEKISMEQSYIGYQYKVITCSSCQHNCAKMDKSNIPSNSQTLVKDVMEIKGSLNSYGYCVCCKGKCHWAEHKLTDYEWVQKKYSVTKDLNDIRMKYLEFQNNNDKAKESIKNFSSDYIKIISSFSEKQVSIQSIVSKIQGLALRPAIFNNKDYYNMIIAHERKEKKKGWEKRLVEIENLMETDALLQELSSYNLFDKLEQKLKSTSQSG